MKTLIKECEISAPRARVFEALTEPMSILQWTGDEAVMENEAGGFFSLWSGSIHGKNLEVTPSKIVQDWKEKNWSNYSKVTLELSEENGITLVRLIHEGIPKQSFSSLDEGWDKYYLGALKSYLES